MPARPAAAGENAPDRLVGDVGVAEGERAEASKARRGERDDAEAEPAERHPLQRVPGLEQVAGELKLQKHRQVQDVHLDLPGALLTAAAIHPMTSHPNEPSLGPAAPDDGGDASATRSTSSGALCSAWSRRRWLTVATARAGGWPRAKSWSMRSSTRKVASAWSHWAPHRRESALAQQPRPKVDYLQSLVNIRYMT